MKTKGKIIAATPLICVIVYLTIGILFDGWHPTWMIFFLIPLMPMILDRKPLRAFYPLLITIAFLIMGFAFDGWIWCWILFLTIPLFYIFFPNKHKSVGKEHYKEKEYNFRKIIIDENKQKPLPRKKIIIDDEVNFIYEED